MKGKSRDFLEDDVCGVRYRYFTMKIHASIVSDAFFLSRMPKKNRIVEKIGPGMCRMKEASQTDPHNDQWNQELEYATPAVAPLRQFCDQALTWF
jgi:hypothetical protein